MRLKSHLSLLRRFSTCQRGAIAVIFSLATPVLIGCIGIAIDAVYWYMEQHKLQASTDQAAMSAAYALQSGQSGSALNLETNNHFEKLYGSKSSTLNVTVNNPPLSSTYAGNNQAIEVITSRPQPLFFSRLFKMESVEVHARAVSLFTSQTEFCILGLSKSEDNTVEFTGSAVADLGCGIASNSEASNAVYISGNSNLNTTGISTAGDILEGGSSTVSTDIPLETHAPPVPDPYGPEGRNLQVPGFPTACAAQNLKINSDTTLSPGRYCGGISFQNGTTTLNPGVYLIDAGNFKSVGGASIVGQDVTIILTGNGSKYAELDIAGGSTISLSAPTSGGDFEGVLFFQDPDAPAYQGNNLIRNKIVGNSSLDLNGAIYIPNQELEFSGGSDGNTTCLQIVAGKVSFSGNTQITSNCQAGDGTETIAHLSIKLVE